MHLCYIDESGTSNISGNTSHFILVGIAIPVWHWRDSDREIQNVKTKYNLHTAEIHTAWLLRKYLEQTQIPYFDSLDYHQRRHEVGKIRKSELYRLQKSNNPKQYKQTRKQTHTFI